MALSGNPVDKVSRTGVESNGDLKFAMQQKAKE
jgi:hypothetical protein